MTGKRLVNAYKNVDKNKSYSLKEAVALVKANAGAKFDETIDLAINLGVDPKYADQMVRGVCGLPHGNGKTVRVAVMAQAKKPMRQKLPVPISSVPRIWLTPFWRAKSNLTAASLPRI